MEAFRDRTIKIDVPYNTVLSDEVKIYEKDYNSERISGKHIAPHTIEVADVSKRRGQRGVASWPWSRRFGPST